MSHSKSTEIWKLIKPLEYLQFPWRFLTLAVFSASFLSGAVAYIFQNKRIFYSLILALLILLNGNYFKPREWYPNMTDREKFSGKSWQLLVTSGIFDYLPKWAPQPPAHARGNEINTVAGQVFYSPFSFRSNYQEYLVTALDSGAAIELQTYYFPGWKIYLDGQEVSIDPSSDPLLGRMQVNLSPGTHTLIARFTSTPIRGLGNSLSLFSWVLVLVTPIIAIWRRKSRWGMWT